LKYAPYYHPIDSATGMAVTVKGRPMMESRSLVMIGLYFLR